MKSKLVITICCLLAGLPGCTSDSDSAEQQIRQRSGPLNVVCTTNIVKDLVQQIGGDRVSVTAIMDGPGIDPHSYTPSPKDTNAMTAADVVVYSGLHLEGQLTQALESLEHRGVPAIAVAEVLNRTHDVRLLTTEEDVPDPHVWFDPEIWATCGQWLADELSDLDPEGRAEYQQAAEEFSKQMTETKQQALELVNRIPAERRVLVTAHDAFEYFARAFDFRVEAVQGVSTESEPGVRRINDLVQLLVDQQIRAVFTEQSVSEKNIEALVAGCAAAGHELKIGAKLYSDTVGAEGTPEATLSGALLYNVRQIVDALAGQEASDP